MKEKEILFDLYGEQNEENEENMPQKDEREELLQLHDSEQLHEENLSFKTLIMVYLAVLIALGIFLPKIYIANQIYYISREISEISDKRDVLLEENKALRIKLENLRYKNQILNPLQEKQWK